MKAITANGHTGPAYQVRDDNGSLIELANDLDQQRLLLNVDRQLVAQQRCVKVTHMEQLWTPTKQAASVSANCCEPHHRPSQLQALPKLGMYGT